MTAGTLKDFEFEPGKPGIYRLGQYSPVSIRDQIVRAHYLVAHLWGEKILRPESRLVVVGAGAAGLAAVDAAAARAVASVTLVERTDTFMPLQAQTKSRWLDPVQYDWPARHWADTQWPLPGTSLLVSFPTLNAQSAANWAVEFQNRIGKLLIQGAFTHKPERTAGAWTVKAGVTSLPLADEHGKVVEVLDCDILILAAGFGIEHSAVPFEGTTTDFWGLGFWDQDKFQDADMGLPASTKGALVSGSGDGALQEFVRLTTGLNSAEEVLRPAWAAANAGNWKEQLIDLWHWEAHAAVSRSFAPHPHTQCTVFQQLEARYALAIDALMKSDQWKDLTNALMPLLQARNPGSVRLIRKCNHFGQCYGLNRAVCLIVLRCLEQLGHANVMRSHVALKSTSHEDSSCACRDRCWGHRHKAYLAKQTSCTTRDDALPHWDSAKVSFEEYDGLVIRHGIDPLKYGGQTLARMTAQLAPFHLP